MKRMQFFLGVGDWEVTALDDAVEWSMEKFVENGFFPEFFSGYLKDTISLLSWPAHLLQHRQLNLILFNIGYISCAASGLPRLLKFHVLNI